MQMGHFKCEKVETFNYLRIFIPRKNERIYIQNMIQTGKEYLEPSEILIRRDIHKYKQQIMAKYVEKYLRRKENNWNDK